MLTNKPYSACLLYEVGLVILYRYTMRQWEQSLWGSGSSGYKHGRDGMGRQRLQMTTFCPQSTYALGPGKTSPSPEPHLGKALSFLWG